MAGCFHFSCVRAIDLRYFALSFSPYPSPYFGLPVACAISSSIISSGHSAAFRRSFRLCRNE